MATRRVNFSATYNFRAVQEEDGSVSGVVRTTAKRGISNIAGICAVFQATDEQLFIAQKDLFFYGAAKDLDANYRSRCPIPNDQLSEMRDIHGGSHGRGASVIIKSGYPSGYFSIPYTQLGLDSGKRELTLDTLKHLEEIMHCHLPKFERKRADNWQAREAFRNFPLALSHLARERGTFLSHRTQITRTTVEQYERPPLRIISTPMGGMPGWAKDYMRTH